MSTHLFSINHAFHIAWERWKSRWELLLSASIFSLLLPLIPQLFQEVLPPNAMTASFLLGLIHFFFLLGLLCLGIGFLITMPLVALCWAYVYLQLSATKEIHA